MTFFAIFLPKSRRAAAYTLLIVAIISAIILSITGIAFLKEKAKLNTWIKTEATVTEYDEPEPGRHWTVFTYEIDGKEYTGRNYGIGRDDIIGNTRTILCNPKDPAECTYIENVTELSTSKILLQVESILCSVFVILYGAIYLYYRYKEPKGRCDF